MEIKLIFYKMWVFLKTLTFPAPVIFTDFPNSFFWLAVPGLLDSICWQPNSDLWRMVVFVSCACPWWWNRWRHKRSSAGDSLQFPAWFWGLIVTRFVTYWRQLSRNTRAVWLIRIWFIVATILLGKQPQLAIRMCWRRRYDLRHGPPWELAASIYSNISGPYIWIFFSTRWQAGPGPTKLGKGMRIWECLWHLKGFLKYSPHLWSGFLFWKGN